eukprot:COSAG02_NODE_898_length_16108_cov_5.877444_8_plen_51_part_00
MQSNAFNEIPYLHYNYTERVVALADDDGSDACTFNMKPYTYFYFKMPPTQ